MPDTPRLHDSIEKKTASKVFNNVFLFHEVFHVAQGMYLCEHFFTLRYTMGSLMECTKEPN